MSYHTLEPSIRIGKTGITENVVKQVKDLLKKRKIIKVKFLPTAIKEDKKALVEELAKKTNSKIKQQVGFVVVLEKVK